MDFFNAPHDMHVCVHVGIEVNLQIVKIKNT